MSDAHEPDGLDSLSNRLWSLATAEDESDGLTQLAVGVSAFVEELDGEWRRSHGDELSVILSNLIALVDRSNSSDEPPGAPRSRSVTTPGGLEAFLERFRAEAKKRLAGLSISLVGVFNEEGAEQAIDQSTTHLHAIRGGAAMLGLSSIADLSGVMEDAILARRETPVSTRVWPVKPLLRGFAVLRTAIEDPDEPHLDMALADATAELRDILGRTTKVREPRRKQRPGRDLQETPTIKVPRETGFDRKKSSSDVSTRKLEQRILIVDDVETIAASVGLILSELDIPVDVAQDGDEALARLRDMPYSLVITDIDMPGMNGLELTRIMRADDAIAELPIILLTSLDKESEREAGIEAGADDYIVKGSIGGGELVKRVAGFLKEAPYVPAVDAADEPRHQRVLVVEDTETVAASIAFVLSEGSFDIVLAHDGQDALHKLESEDFDLVLSDVEMPSLDGISLTKRIKGHDEWHRLPVILLTARDSGSTEAQAEEAGADLYLIKGEVGGGRLLEIVEGFLATGVS